MSRQLPIGESGYIPESRKHHGKHILIGGQFDGQIVTLAKNSFNTTVFNIVGEIGRYAAKSKLDRPSAFYKNTAIVQDESVNFQEHGSILPALFWEPVRCK